MLSLESTRYATILVLLLSIGLSKSCGAVPPEYDAFFSLDTERQRQKAKDFSIEKQIDFYLAGKRYVHPPSSTLLYVIAERGKEAVPALLERMKQTKSESDKLDLLDVIRNINEFHVRLNDDEVLIDQLKDITAKMQDPQRKAEAEQMLTDILATRRVLPLPH